MNAARLELDQTRRLVELCEDLHARPGIAALHGEFDSGVRDLILESGGVVYQANELFGS